MIRHEEERERDLRRSLVATLTGDGTLRDPRWIAAFQAVPRHLFVPRFLLDRTHTGTYDPVDGNNPAQHREWLERIYADEPLVTRAEGGFPVSSSSQPSLMADMLEALQITGPERILEIGTGTGYNAALLCQGLANDARVFSVDIDPDLVEAARRRLGQLGYRPHVVTTNGAKGYPDGAPYDRIIATCSLPRVPVEWITQTAEGGLILVNLYRELGGGALVLLRAEDGQASGHFMPYSGGFMPSRTLTRVPGSELLAAHRSHYEHERCDGVERPTTISEEALQDDTFAMVAALRVDAQRLGLLPDDEPEQFWLLGRDGSWAYQTTAKTGGLIAVQGGPVKLWDQLEAAYRDWTALGRTGREQYGLTVTREGEHLIWHDHPGGPSWRL